MNAKFGDQEYKCLIDTGSEVSLVATKLYEVLKESGAVLAELEGGNLQMQGPFEKSKKVKGHAQILVELQVDGATLQSVFVVTELQDRLMVVLGDNFLRKYKAVIDYEESEIKLNVKSEKMAIKVCQTEFKSTVQYVRMVENVEEKMETIVRESGDQHNLTDTQQEKFRELLLKYEKFFSQKPGLTHKYVHEIKMRDHTPFYQKPYPIPVAYRPKVDLELQKMVSWGIIEEASTPFVSPMVVIIKKDGSLRLCLDLRKLNSQIFLDHQKPVNIEEILMRFHGKLWFTSVDLVKAYWQIPLQAEDRKYTGFSIGYKTYQFLVLPFGLATAVASFTRALEQVLGPELLEFTIIYIDDGLVASTTFEEHLRHLDLLLDRLQSAGFTGNLEKSQFLKKELFFVGHQISAEGIRPCPSQIQQVLEYPKPKTIKQLKSFLGKCSWLRKFVPHFSALTGALYDLLKRPKLIWTEESYAKFLQIKTAMSQISVLRHPDPNKTLYIQTDTSFDGMAAVLYQLDEDGERAILQWASRTLKPAEKNYSVVEIEAAALIFAVTKWQIYLMGRHFVIRTDHHALAFLQQCRPPNARLIRFLMFLQQYNFTIEYTKGRENFLADYLSRFPEDNENEKGIIQKTTSINAKTSRKKNSKSDVIELKEEEKTIATKSIGVAAISVIKDLSDQLKKIGKLQDQQMDLKVLKESLASSSGKLPNYTLHNEVLFKNVDGRWLLVLPEIMIENVLKNYHDMAGHFGIRRTTKFVEENFTFEKMREKIKQFVVRCEICQKTKYNNQPLSVDFRPVVSACPNDLVSSDVFGPLPTGRGKVRYVLVLLDVFSKLVKLYPMARATTQAILSKYQLYFDTVAQPKRILSDRGTQYTAKKYKSQLADWNVEILYTSVRHPEANPVERQMKELGRLCRAYCAHSHKSWAHHIKEFETWLNSAWNSVTGFPAEAVHFDKIENPVKKIIRFPNDLSNDLIDYRDAAKKNSDKAIEIRKKKNPPRRLEPAEFKLGECVLLKVEAFSSAIDGEIKKFFPLYDGPFEVAKVIHFDTYQLKEVGKQKIRGTFNIKFLKKYVS